MVLENPNITNSLYKFTVENYHKLSDSGILPRNLELLFGGIVSKMTFSPIHAFLVNQLRELIQKNLPTEYYIRQQNPISIIELSSEPEPDLVILKGSQRDYSYQHPTTAFWVIEISQSTLNIDREKAKIYATANIQTFWILNLIENTIEVYAEPNDGEYTHKEIFSKTETVPYPSPIMGSFKLQEFV